VRTSVGVFVRVFCICSCVFMCVHLCLCVVCVCVYPSARVGLYVCITSMIACVRRVYERVYVCVCLRVCVLVLSKYVRISNVYVHLILKNVSASNSRVDRLSFLSTTK
jgi:hypothetical protein